MKKLLTLAAMAALLATPAMAALLATPAMAASDGALGSTSQGTIGITANLRPQREIGTSGLSDIPLGDIRPGQTASASEQFCVYGTGLGLYYTLTLQDTSVPGSAQYHLYSRTGAARNRILFTVDVESTGRSGVGHTQFFNVPAGVATTLNVNGDEPTCENGKGFTQLSINAPVPATGLSEFGSYVGEISLTITPQ